MQVADISGISLYVLYWTLEVIKLNFGHIWRWLILALKVKGQGQICPLLFDFYNQLILPCKMESRSDEWISSYGQVSYQQYEDSS